MTARGRIPEELRGESNQDIKRVLWGKPAFNTKAAAQSAENRWKKLGFRHAPGTPVVHDPLVRRRHWTQPTWWERTKGADGGWAAVPHYGKAVKR